MTLETAQRFPQTLEALDATIKPLTYVEGFLVYGTAFIVIPQKLQCGQLPRGIRPPKWLNEGEQAHDAFGCK